MSKNLTIDEGGESRHFDGVKRLKTKLAGEDGGSCYWVPEDETQAWPTFIMNNGMHVAAEEGHYGYSEANVNVFIPTPFPEFDVWIDDIDVPHIYIDDITIDDLHIDDIELTIDPDLGTPIVDLDGIDMDGFEIPDIDIRMPDGFPISDIDFKTDIHVWTDPDDHTKIHIKEEPNGEEIVLDYDDIDGTVTFKDLLNIRYDDTVIGEEQWVIEAHTKIKVDDVDYEAGDEIKSWDKDEIVDFTMKVEQVISVDFPDIDPDFGEDFDIKLDLDNMELDMDGLDMDIDLPLLKMPDDKLPDEIRIMHVPDKTSYKDGEAIDLDGIVVQAYKNGSVWQNKKYINGYIPVHELDISELTASIENVTKVTAVTNDNKNTGYFSVDWSYIEEFKDVQNPSGPWKRYTRDGYIHILAPFAVVYISTSTGETQYLNIAYSISDGVIDESIAELYMSTHSSEPYYSYRKRPGMNWRQYTYAGKTVVMLPNLQSCIVSASDRSDWHLIQGANAIPPVLPKYEFLSPEEHYQAVWDLIYNSVKGYDIEVSWSRPVDGLALTASFQISVDPAEDTTSTGN